MTTMTATGAARVDGWAGELRATLALGWPLILTNVAQIAIATTDVVMLGWLGPEALAAGALGTNFYFTMYILGIGLAQATQPMLAQERGRNRFSIRELRRTVRQGFWICLFAVLPVWLVLWNGETALLAMQQQPDLAAQAGEYIRVLMWSLLPAFWFNVLRCFVNAMERPAAALVIVIFGILLNAAVNYTLIFGHFGAPRLGLTGAAVATVATHTTMFLALYGYLSYDRRFRRFHLLGRFWRSDWSRFLGLAALGIPISITLALETTVFNLAAFLQGLINMESLAAHSIALQISAVAFMVPLGLAQAATVRVGLAAGRGDRAGVGRAGWAAFMLGVGFMSCTALLFLTIPEFFAGFFLDPAVPANAATLAITVVFLKMAGAFQIADGVQVIGAGVLRGLKDTRIPMYMAAFGYWVMGLPLGAALAFHAGFGGVGIWLGIVSGLSTAAVLFVWRWSRRESLGLV